MHPFVVHTRRDLSVAHLVRSTLLTERSLDIPSDGLRVYVSRIEGENPLPVVRVEGEYALLGNVHHPLGARLSLLHLLRSHRLACIGIGRGHFQLNTAHTLDSDGICVYGVAIDRIVVNGRSHISQMNVVGDIRCELLLFSLGGHVHLHYHLTLDFQVGSVLRRIGPDSVRGIE